MGSVVAGDCEDTFASDGAHEVLKEKTDATTQLDHTWTLAGVPAGAKVEFHVEGFRTTNTNGDDFRFAWSTNGTSYTELFGFSLPTTDLQRDLRVALPFGVSGTVFVRIRDTLSAESPAPVRRHRDDRRAVDSRGALNRTDRARCRP